MPIVYDYSIPFNPKHLVKFKRELKLAGGDFDALMKKKEALKTEKNGLTYINLYNDVEAYKRKYLTGGYVTLRPHYDTEVPYVFWSKLYMLLVQKSTQHKI